jgi:ABC-type sugar transport system permease subunit
MIIFIAALVGIPKEYYEAADMDGAGAWQQLIFITLPSIRAIYLSSLILSLQLSLSAFIYPYLMTQGGPLHISETPVSYSLYLLYSQQEWGYASAVNVLIFILGVVAVTLLWRAGRVRTE